MTPTSVPWYRRPDGTVHAFRGIRSVCRRWTWQANCSQANETDERCRECVAAINEKAGATASAR